MFLSDGTATHHELRGGSIGSIGSTGNNESENDMQKNLIDRIRENGFEIELNGDDFIVTPDDKLTSRQREFMRTNREEIMHELLATVVFTIWGKAITLQAKDAVHQAWLLDVNHKTTTPSHLIQEFSQ